MKLSKESISKDLPEHLAERTRFVATATEVADGEIVLYWLHHAMRADENPALDVAVSISNRYRLPLLVVTDEMPVQPIRGWIEKLPRMTNAMVLAVDTACVAPMMVVGKAYDRAFEFRKATESLYRERVSRTWQAIEPPHDNPHIDLPFERLTPTPGDLTNLIANCDIDHSIAPVPDSQGGSAAGYARWNDFKRDGLNAYARRRNDPLADGTSRLSPYLHYGMVSPLRIARESAVSQTSGADKFPDELLIWRELAYAFCMFTDDLDSVSAVPDWARTTLAEHQSDSRPANYSWETLARGRTGDRLWDAAQRSLLIHGELHNNVRMTWGKALLQWTSNAETALAMMIDLNHRYALDGRDPASYGGILWCLGQFDRPFKPPQPIFGTVRSRSTKQHAKRLDSELYFKQTTRPLMNNQTRVAVLGAGISGLICARTLCDHGIEVKVFEKSRGVGGRMATRRTSEGLRFDHGAQYFTARDQRFERYVDSWLADGIVGPWDGRVCTLADGDVQWKQNETRRFVGVPGMNAVCRHLASELDVQLNTKLVSPEVRNDSWLVADDQGQELGSFDYFVTSAPAPQSAELLSAAPDLRHAVESAKMSGCWAVMLGLDESLDLPFDGAFVDNSPLSWIARNDSKRNRVSDCDDRVSEREDRVSERECWVLHASPSWTAKHLESDPDEVSCRLVQAFWQSTGAVPRPANHLASHRWRFALPPKPLEQSSLFNADLRVGACGDWCAGPRVEGAFLSGMSLAGRMLADLLHSPTNSG